MPCPNKKGGMMTAQIALILGFIAGACIGYVYCRWIEPRVQKWADAIRPYGRK
jgi:membrane protein DedA with SNARE-associated domain